MSESVLVGIVYAIVIVLIGGLAFWINLEMKAELQRHRDALTRINKAVDDYVDYVERNRRHD